MGGWPLFGFDFRFVAYSFYKPSFGVSMSVTEVVAAGEEEGVVAEAMAAGEEGVVAEVVAAEEGGGLLSI